MNGSSCGWRRIHQRRRIKVDTPVHAALAQEIQMKHAALFLALCPWAFAASAQTSTPATSRASVDATAIGPDAVEKPGSRDRLADRNCLTETGSHIAPVTDRNGRQCINAPGRAYSREDIDRTGTFDLTDALRRLDPAVH